MMINNFEMVFVDNVFIEEVNINELIEDEISFGYIENIEIVIVGMVEE